MYILVTILSTHRFFVKDEQIKILILKDVMMTFREVRYLVADFVRVRTYRVVKIPKIISKNFETLSVKTFFLYFLH